MTDHTSSGQISNQQKSEPVNTGRAAQCWNTEERTNEPRGKKRSYLRQQLSHSIPNISIGFCLSPLGLRNLQSAEIFML